MRFFCLTACALLTAAGLRAENAVSNGGFSDGLTGWTPWVVRNSGGGDFSASVNAGELEITGTDIYGGVYQQFHTGGAGRVVNVTGSWRSEPTVPGGMWAEVWIINADRAPTPGVAETDGANGAILLYRNDTFGGRGAWNGVMPQTAPVKYQVSFTAAAEKATLVLCTGNNPGISSGTIFDNITAESVFPPATPSALPAGFASRQMLFPASGMALVAQHPISRKIYVVQNGSGSSIYRIDPSADPLAATSLGTISSSGLEFADGCQGMTFDAAGNMYVISLAGDLLKGTYEAGTETFSFSVLLDIDETRVGGHGTAGLVIGPDNKLYMNSGALLQGNVSEGEEGDTGLNARVLRVNLDGTGLESFCRGIRNTYGITFRLDGMLFGVDNGPDCAYAEELNLLQQGNHYGYPYRYGADVSGSDGSVDAQCIFTPPPELVLTPSWSNYGPDAKPAAGQRGYQDGGVYYGLNPNSSPNGITFYEPQRMDPGAILFPAEYRGRAFIARFGNQIAATNPPNVGHDILSVRLDDAAHGFFCNTFLTGLGRAIQVLAAENGRLYILEYNQQQTLGGPGGGAASRLTEIRYTIPESPVILASPSAINSAADIGENAAPATFTVANGGVDTLEYSVVVDDAPAWLQVSPSGGQSSGIDDEDTFTITYDVAGQPLGVLTASIRIRDPQAYNDPLLLPVTLTVKSVLPDFDQDRDVDQSDFGLLQSCLSTFTGEPIPAPCARCDLDGDGTVDAGDFNALLNCFAGPQVHADKSCDDAWE